MEWERLSTRRRASGREGWTALVVIVSLTAITFIACDQPVDINITEDDIEVEAADGQKVKAPMSSMEFNGLENLPTPTPTLVMWRGLAVAAENRCSTYRASDYRYSSSIEAKIVREMGGIIYGPYTGTHFASTRETDIEHMVARSEAHDSGLCGTDDATKRAFASDLLNLTLASPNVNRYQKSSKDAAEWLPTLNKCWFADAVVKVRVKYGMTIDKAEADALEAVIAACTSFDMVVVPTPTPTP